MKWAAVNVFWIGHNPLLKLFACANNLNFFHIFKSFFFLNQVNCILRNAPWDRKFTCIGSVDCLLPFLCVCLISSRTETQFSDSAVQLLLTFVLATQSDVRNSLVCVWWYGASHMCLYHSTFLFLNFVVVSIINGYSFGLLPMRCINLMFTAT